MQGIKLQMGWWCYIEGAFIRQEWEMALPVCCPQKQCTGGRRANLPCGFHALVPINTDRLEYDD
jgi:hypothetical protein